MDERLAVVYYKNHFIHRPAISSPENPERISQVMGYLKGRADFFPEKGEMITNFPSANREDLLRVHDEEYLSFVEKYSEGGGGFLGDSTYFSKNTFKAAAMSAGGAKIAAELVWDEDYRYSLALIRPPGHHASQERFGGYCIFNNAAVAIRYLQQVKGVKKAMIVDWDAHAGNGTMHVFYEDPTVLNISIHRDPHDFYPHDGFSHQIGRGAGRGYTVNMEMPQGAGDDAYREVFKKIVIPLMNQFNPDIVICLNGFDAHYSDPVSKLSLTTKGYYDIVRMLVEKKRKMAFLLEGGYTVNNGPLTHAIAEAIIGDELSYTEGLDPLSTTILSPDKVFKIVNEKIEHLKENLQGFWTFE